MNKNLTNQDLKKALEYVCSSLDSPQHSQKSVAIELHKLLDVIEEDNQVSLPQYKGMPLEEMNRQIERITNLWSVFICNNDAGLSNEQVDINTRNLTEVVERVDKRRYHYRVFHNMNELSELREVALLCYWINKLKPFTVLKKDSPLRNSANEFFCIFLIMSMIEHLTQMARKEFRMPDDCLIKDAVYSFKYRDLSKESFILFVSSIAQNYGVSVDSFI